MTACMQQKPGLLLTMLLKTNSHGPNADSCQEAGASAGDVGLEGGALVALEADLHLDPAHLSGRSMASPSGGMRIKLQNFMVTICGQPSGILRLLTMRQVQYHNQYTWPLALRRGLWMGKGCETGQKAGDPRDGWRSEAIEVREPLRSESVELGNPRLAASWVRRDPRFGPSKDIWPGAMDG